MTTTLILGGALFLSVLGVVAVIATVGTDVRPAEVTNPGLHLFVGDTVIIRYAGRRAEEKIVGMGRWKFHCESGRAYNYSETSDAISSGDMTITIVRNG